MKTLLGFFLLLTQFALSLSYLTSICFNGGVKVLGSRGWVHTVQCLSRVLCFCLLPPEVSQKGVLLVERRRRQLGLSSRRENTADALPPDTASQVPEDHRQGLKVPGDGAQRA